MWARRIGQPMLAAMWIEMVSGRFEPRPDTRSHGMDVQASHARDEISHGHHNRDAVGRLDERRGPDDLSHRVS